MAAKENMHLIEQYQQALRDQDWDGVGSFIADDAVFRMAGVPRAMGGVNEGRAAIMAVFRQNAGSGTFEVRQVFGADNTVCVVGKVTARRFAGNQHLRGADKPYTAHECVVHQIANNKIVESTAYINWLDPYVQTGIVDPSSLRS